MNFYKESVQALSGKCFPFRWYEAEAKCAASFRDGMDTGIHTGPTGDVCIHHLLVNVWRVAPYRAIYIASLTSQRRESTVGQMGIQ